MTLNGDLTIVLPIKDRPSFTLRWMDYANGIAFPFKVLIADGGRDESVTAQLSDPASYPNLKYEYIRYPYDAAYSEYYAKMADVLGKVNTEFAALVDDDDFLIVDGLLRSVDFLKRNPDFSACRGRIVAFSISPDPNKPYGERVEFFMQAASDSITDEEAIARVTRHLSPYDITHYDVHRADALAGHYAMLSKLDPDNIILAELLTSCLAVAHGKVMRGDYLYMARQQNPDNSCNKEEARRKGDYFDRMMLPTWSDDFNKFVSAVAQAIADTDGTDAGEAGRALKSVYRKHVAPAIIRCLIADIKSEQLPSGPLRMIGGWLERDTLLRKLAVGMYRGMKKSGGGNRRNKDSDCAAELRPIREFITAERSRCH